MNKVESWEAAQLGAEIKKAPKIEQPGFNEFICEHCGKKRTTDSGVALVDGKVICGECWKAMSQRRMAFWRQSRKRKENKND